MSIRFGEPASVRELLIHSSADYADFDRVSGVLKRQAEHCDQIYAEVFHPLKDKFEAAWARDKLPKTTFKAEELQEDDVDGCCCWGTHKVCSLLGSIGKGLGNGIVALWAWICAIGLYVQYGALRLVEECKGEFEGKFEKDFDVLIDKMKQVASASGKSGPISEGDAISLGQRVHIKRLLPELRQTFFDVLESGTAYEKKQAFAKLHEFLTSSDSEEIWVISETNMPTLGQILLLGNRELGVKGLVSDDQPGENLVLELLQNDDYFVAAALGDIITPEDLTETFHEDFSDFQFLQLTFGMLPDWTKMEMEEAYEEMDQVPREVRGPLRHRIVGREPAVIAPKAGLEDDEPHLFTRDDLVPGYMKRKLGRAWADPTAQRKFIGGLQKKSDEQLREALARHPWKAIAVKIRDGYVKTLHEREVLPALRKAIDEMYPAELRKLMSEVEDAPSFGELTELTMDHIDTDRFAQIFTSDLRVGRLGLDEVHRLAIEKVRGQYAIRGQSVPKSWHPTPKQRQACEKALVEAHKKARLDAYNKAGDLAKRYVEQLRFTRNANLDFLDQPSAIARVVAVDDVNFDAIDSDEDEASGDNVPSLGAFVQRALTPPPRVPEDEERDGHLGGIPAFGGLHALFAPPPNSPTGRIVPDAVIRIPGAPDEVDVDASLPFPETLSSDDSDLSESD